MARIARKDLLTDKCYIHKIIKGHNHEWIFRENREKEIYLNQLNQKISDSCKLHSICLMSNHSHEVYFIENRDDFCKLMKEHHGNFAQIYNKNHCRSGKLAIDRPKTILIKTDFQFMCTILYNHANPLRAGIVKNVSELEGYEFSTHILYAYGHFLPWMKNIIFPQWYENLGKNVEERQSTYMKIFRDYVGEPEPAFIQKYGDRWGVSPSVPIST